LFDSLRRDEKKIESDVVGVGKIGTSIHVGPIGGAIFRAGVPMAFVGFHGGTVGTVRTLCSGITERTGNVAAASTTAHAPRFIFFGSIINGIWWARYFLFRSDFVAMDPFEYIDVFDVAKA